jgi:hypothetical protein
MIFAEKFSENIGVFLLKLLLVFAKIVIIILVFEKNANSFAKNWEKSPKIGILSSTPGGIRTHDPLSFRKRASSVSRCTGC